LSHEIRTPLDIISQEASTILKHSGKKFDPTGHANSIMIAASFASNFVQNVIQFGE